MTNKHLLLMAVLLLVGIMGHRNANAHESCEGNATCTADSSVHLRQPCRSRDAVINLQEVF